MMVPSAWRAVSWAELPIECPAPGCTRQALHGAFFTVARASLTRASSIPRHQHVSEQLTLVEAGALRFLFDDGELILREGEMVLVPSNVPHAVEALEDSVALDFFAPRRDDWEHPKN